MKVNEELQLLPKKRNYSYSRDRRLLLVVLIF